MVRPDGASEPLAQPGSASVLGVVVNRPAGDDLVQFNVRVPRSLRDKVDARRERLAEDTGGPKLSRDEWARRVFNMALAQPIGTAVRTPAGRSLRGIRPR